MITLRGRVYVIIQVEYLTRQILPVRWEFYTSTAANGKGTMTGHKICPIPLGGGVIARRVIECVNSLSILSMSTHTRHEDLA
jgi:hypothetical protein